MTRSLVKSDSPMARLRGRRTVALQSSPSSLSSEEQERLEQVLSTRMDCVQDDSFTEEGACERLFDQAPPIPKPNTSWYHPVMEEPAVERQLRSVVNVVLSAEQERALFLQFNYARYRAVQLQRRLGDGAVSDEQARDLLHWYDLAMRLREQIAQSNLALVLAMAKRVRHSEMDFADLISEGNMALLRAIDKFNVSRGFKFSTYACRAILKAFSRSGMKHSQYRQLFPTDFDPALERSDYQGRKNEEHEEECADEVRRIVSTNRARLSEMEQAVIHHRFALNGERQAAPLTLEQVGQIVGLTKERVRQIQNKALAKIRRTLEGSFIDGTPNRARPAPKTS